MNNKKMIIILAIMLTLPVVLAHNEEVATPTLRQYMNLKHYTMDRNNLSVQAVNGFYSQWQNSCLYSYKKEWMLGTIGRTSTGKEICFIGSNKQHHSRIGLRVGGGSNRFTSPLNIQNDTSTTKPLTCKICERNDYGKEICWYDDCNRTE